MRDDDVGKALAGVVVIVLAIAAVYGWVMNIVAIAHSEFIPLTGLLVLRVVGIFIGPLGAVLGWV
jgi:hypothetical protein